MDSKSSTKPRGSRRVKWIPFTEFSRRSNVASSSSSSSLSLSSPSPLSSSPFASGSSFSSASSTSISASISASTSTSSSSSSSVSSTTASSHVTESKGDGNPEYLNKVESPVSMNALLLRSILRPILASGRVKSRFSVRSKAWKELKVVHQNVFDEARRKISDCMMEYTNIKRLHEYYEAKIARPITEYTSEDQVSKVDDAERMNMEESRLYYRASLEETTKSLPRLKQNVLKAIYHAESICTFRFAHKYRTEHRMFDTRFKDNSTSDQKDRFAYLMMTEEDKEKEAKEESKETDLNEKTEFQLVMYRWSLSIFDNDYDSFDSFDDYHEVRRPFTGMPVPAAFDEHAHLFNDTMGYDIRAEERRFPYSTHVTDPTRLLFSVLLPRTTGKYSRARKSSPSSSPPSSSPPKTI